MASKLIVIDGLDGSGKATQSELVTKRLNDLGYIANKISFPDYNSDSSALVKMYLGGEFGDDPNFVNAYVASTFYGVDRVASYLKSWKKLYDESDFIVCDRYTTSNVVHQMAKLNDDQKDKYIEWLFDFEYNKLGIPAPSLVLFLDLDPDVSQRLMLERYKGDETKKDIHEKNVNYLLSCRRSAKEAIEKLNWVNVECTNGGSIKSIDEINDMIMDVIKEKFNM